ncbi:MAG: glycogen debranching protein GlgX [Gemmataceae bacterium]|nr:glycogen debranching protein GlgX [Gemmataceae bacterium]
MQILPTARGRSLPLGATALADGVNFVLFCRHGTAVSLVLYALEGSDLLAEIPLDPRKNRTGDNWHILVGGLPPKFRYGWRVAGPRGGGHRFNPDIILLDPSSTALSDGHLWGRSEEIETANGGWQYAGLPAWEHRGVMEVSGEPPLSHPAAVQRGTLRRSLFFRRAFNWREDEPPLVPLEDSIIYELHVRGFTCHPSSGVAFPGTFAGLVEKIPYLRDLGVTAVELLPIHEFDECDCPFTNPKTGERLRNLWGYNSIAFAALKAAYAASGRDHGQLSEFREMVRAFHAAGIEVFLDVVFNHTGEGDDRGRTYSFRGLDNDLYYLLGPGGTYLNFSGCGNTVNCNHPVVRELILTCLRYWVAEMHVDGLRFDLASVMGRDRFGNVLMDPPVVEMIGEDGVLRDTKLIAEPWDAAGLYQVGRFPFGRRWSEWNGRYRDDVRRFWRGDAGMVGDLATRVCGSADLYETSGRQPRHSINFITCHDGFTLWDLVSYNFKHNDANGENNRDGADENYSWNCGVEGPTDDPNVQAIRHRQARNLMATLLLSQGVPMLLAGDEILRTQRGNNNAWCQDNETSWIHWDLMQRNADFLRFVREMIALRKRHPALRRRVHLQGSVPGGPQPPDVIWHGVEPGQPDFNPSSRTLAFALNGALTGREPDNDFYIACNSWSQAVGFRLPMAPSGRPWRRVVDTAQPPPLDIVAEEEAPLVAAHTTYTLTAFSLIVLITEP